MGEGAIWKFELKISDGQFVKMPRGAQLLAVAEQDGRLCLWAIVNPEGSKWWRVISVVGTGHSTTCRKDDHIGTVVATNGFVWHVFDGGWTELDPTKGDD